MNELLDIILTPPFVPNDDLTQKVAAVLNQELSRTRILLGSKIPRIIAQTPDIQKAEDIRQQINALGLVSFLYKDSGLHGPLHIFSAKSLEFDAKNIIFKIRIAQSYTLIPQNVFLILKGILNTYKEREVITEVKKLNLSATLLTGGIPIRRTVRERTVETASQPEGLIRIFEKNSPDFYLEIKQYSFDYSCLQGDMKPSSLINFNLLAGKIKNNFPEAFFDDKSPPFMSENIDVNCRLIYLAYRNI
jgi:hypothetical protein